MELFAEANPILLWWAGRRESFLENADYSVPFSVFLCESLQSRSMFARAKRYSSVSRTVGTAQVPIFPLLPRVLKLPVGVDPPTFVALVARHAASDVTFSTATLWAAHYLDLPIGV